MMCDEVHVKVNAIHRLKTVIYSLGVEETINSLIPYLDELIGKDNNNFEDDEVLFAIAEELGQEQVFNYLPDKTKFIPLLEKLARCDETVVREQAATSLTNICNALPDSEVVNNFVPAVIKLATSEWFPGRVTSCQLFTPCYPRAGPQKERLRKKFIELCNEDTPMIRRACASRLG